MLSRKFEGHMSDPPTNQSSGAPTAPHGSPANDPSLLSAAVEKTAAWLKLDKAVKEASGTIGIIKYGLIAATIGVQVLKVDLSLFKLDEKGFTYRGRSFLAFDSADVKKRIENQVAKEQKEVIEKLRPMKKDLDDTTRKLR